MAIFIKGRERTLICSKCKAQAVSVCSYSGDGIHGCRGLFCEEHGVFPEKLKFTGLIVKEVSDEHLRQNAQLSRKFAAMLNLGQCPELRACLDCVNRLVVEQRKKKVFALTKQIVALVSTILVVGAFIFFVLLPDLINPTVCEADSLFSEAFDLCVVNRELALADYLLQMEIENPPGFCRTESHYGGTLLEVICKCPAFEKIAKKIIINGTVTLHDPCRELSCPADGTSYVSVPGDCLSDLGSQMYTTNFTSDDGQSISCPMGSLYLSRRKSCLTSSCGKKFIKHPVTFLCETCPPYLRPVTIKNNRCSFSYSGSYRSQINSPWYLMPNGQFRRWPEHSGHPENAFQADLLSEFGYYPLVIDEFGYWVAPVVRDQKKSRACRWEEMVIRWMINCWSPCKPCLEKWNFLTKQCEPADEGCSALGLELWSPGECYSSGTELIDLDKEYKCS